MSRVHITNSNADVECNEGLPAKCGKCGRIVRTSRQRDNHYGSTGHARFTQIEK
jgi:hypothetical protein